MGRNTPESPGNAKKRRRTTTPASVPQSSPVPDLVPPPLSGYGDTVYASNPFDDAPAALPAGMPHPGGMSGMGPPGHGGGMPAQMQGGHGPPMGAGPMGPMPPNGMAGPYGPNMFHIGPGGSGSMGHGPGMAGNGLGPGGMMPGMSGPSSMPGNSGPMNHMSHNMPPVSTMQSMNDVGGPMGMGVGMPAKGMSHSSRKVYPPDQPMVFNPQNPNAPPIYPCGMCHKEVHENDQAILCESGCNFWFHRMCTGLMEQAYHLLIAEVYAEWVCDRCLSTKNIPLIKFKP